MKTELDDEIEITMEEFFLEHGRTPYGADEFMRWYSERAKSMAAQIRMQLDAQGLTVTDDGRIVPKGAAS